MSLAARDERRVRALTEQLGSYEPGEVHVFQSVVDSLREAFDADQCLTFRCERAEFGWYAEYVYGSDPAVVVGFRRFLESAPEVWSKFYPRAAPAHRNCVLRPKAIVPAGHPEGRAVRAFESEFQPAENDNLGVALYDNDVGLAWLGSGRPARFTGREESILAALIKPLRDRVLLDHQLGRANATEAALVAAMEAIPTAALLVRGASIAHANATARIMLHEDRPSLVAQLKASLASPESAPFAVTPIAEPGTAKLALLVRRAGDAAEVTRRRAAMAKRFDFTARQTDVLALLARGYGNKTIALQLRCSVPTVENHVTAILGKARVESRAALVARFWTTL